MSDTEKNVMYILVWQEWLNVFEFVVTGYWCTAKRYTIGFTSMPSYFLNCQMSMGITSKPQRIPISSSFLQLTFFASSNSIFVFHLLLSSTMFLQLQSLELCRINVFTTNTPTTFCRLRFRKKRLSFVLHFDNCDNVKCVWNIWRRNHFGDITMIIVATCVCEYELQTP